MNYKAIITVGPKSYTVLLPGKELNIKDAIGALQFVRFALLDDGVFSNGVTEALEINCLDKYDDITVVEDVEAPVLPAVEPAEADQVIDAAKEYSLANVSAFNYLGQLMDVSLLVYYADNHRVLMPSMINGGHAYGYMAEKNVVALICDVATGRLNLTPDQYTVLLYPGPLVDMEDAIEYLRDWVRSRAEDIYIPKIKNAKAFTGWNEKGN